MKIQPYGDSALLISFEQKIDEEINRQVISLYHALEGNEGCSFLIPAYASLTVGVNKAVWTLSEATLFISQRLQNSDFENSPSSGRELVVPVCYEEQFSPDMEDMMKMTGLNRDEIISIHCSKAYRVFMLGFVAGFAYMGPVDKSIQCARKGTPRLKVPAGSVGIAGLQTGIYPIEAPGGWQIIGQTPLAMFDPKRDEASLLKPGDQVTFRPIGKEEFQIIKLKIETGIFEMELAHG